MAKWKILSNFNHIDKKKEYDSKEDCEVACTKFRKQYEMINVFFIPHNEDEPYGIHESNISDEELKKREEESIAYLEKLLK